MAKEKIRKITYHYVHPDGRYIGASSNWFYDTKTTHLFMFPNEKDSFLGKAETSIVDTSGKWMNYLIEMIDPIPPRVAEQYFRWAEGERFSYLPKSPQTILIETERRFPEGLHVSIPQEISGQEGLTAVVFRCVEAKARQGKKPYARYEVSAQIEQKVEITDSSKELFSFEMRTVDDGSGKVR